MKKPIYRVLVLLLIVLAISLTGCKPKEEEAKPVAFEFWTTLTQADRMAIIDVLIDTYQALYPDVTINLIAVEEDDVPAQIRTAAAAKTLPALAEMGAENAVAFGSEDLLDMETATDLIETVGKDEFYAGTLRLVESGKKGKYYSVPYHGWVQGIWYRDDWFTEAGLNPPAAWEDIEKASKTFYNPAENRYGILVGTTAETFTEQCFTPIAMSNGASLFDKNGKLIFNSPEMKEAVEFYARIARYNPPGPQTWRARDYYLQGRMAGFFYSSYIMDDLALAEVAAGSLTGENFADLAGADFDPDLVDHTRLASIITNKKPAGYGVVDTFGFPKQDDPAKTDAASKFLRYLFTPNAYITFLHMAPGGMNPVLKEIAVNERFQNDPKGIFKHYGKEKMAEIIQGLDSIETFSIVEGNRIEAASVIFSKQIIPQMLYKITQEGMDVDEAMSWAEEEMKKEID